MSQPEVNSPEQPWIVRVGEEEFVAKDFKMLNEWRAAGRVPATALLYHPSLGEWQPAASVFATPSSKAASSSKMILLILAAIPVLAVGTCFWVGVGSVAVKQQKEARSDVSQRAATQITGSPALRVLAVEASSHDGFDAPREQRGVVSVEQSAQCSASLTLESLRNVPLQHVRVRATWPDGMTAMSAVNLQPSQRVRTRLEALVPLPNWSPPPQVTSTAESYRLWNLHLAERRATLQRICVEPTLAFMDASGSVLSYSVATSEEQQEIIQQQNEKVIREFQDQNF